MLRRENLGMGFAVAGGLLMGAMWRWQKAEWIGLGLGMSGQSAMWGVRCAAVGIGAAGQVLLLTIMGRWVYARDLISDVLRVGGVLAVVLAGVTAVALALVAR